jgi:hypothetical protein
VIWRFQERLGERFVGAGIAGSARVADADGYADVDVIVAARGVTERWRIPEDDRVFDVFVIDSDRIDMSGRSTDFDHIVRLLGDLDVMRDTGGVLKGLMHVARRRLRDGRDRATVPSFVLYAPIFDAQRKLRRALGHGDDIDCRLKSVALVTSLARLLIVEGGAWLDGDYLHALEETDRAAAKLARAAVAEPDARAAARKALIFSSYALQQRPGIEQRTLWRRTSGPRRARPKP